METLESRDLPGVLATNTLLEGPTGGSDSVILTTTDTWTATSNASWLHTTVTGTGSAVVDFTTDANTGATRTGTLTIDGLTLTVTQAGSNYVAANIGATLVSTGLSEPEGVAVDSSGNVYIADTNNNAVKEYVAATQTVKTLVSSGLNGPEGVAVDSSGNVYIADLGNNAIKEYVAATQTVKILVSGLNGPEGVAVDGSGNVYFSDFVNGAVKEYVTATGMVKTLVSGLSHPSGVAVDSSGNVYFADLNSNVVEEFVASTGMVKTLVSTGLINPLGVAVDSSGNVYIADNNSNAAKEYVAATGTVNTLVSGLNEPGGVAVDGSGNVYIADFNNNAVKELVRAYVPTSPVMLPNAAGSSQLAVVLPSTESLTAPFAPTSDQSWLTITGTNNGVVSYSFTGNTSATARTAHITVLGQAITVTQAGISLGTSNLLEGPSAGTDSVLLTASNAWTATSNASWLHTTATGTGSTVVDFTFDQNTGATRTGMLTIDGLTLTVTQAGSNYSAANPVATLVSTGLNNPHGVAVDSSGNIYIADTSNNAVKEYVAATGMVKTLVSSGLNQPVGVAVDSSGNVYFSDAGNAALKEYVAATGVVKTLVSTGLNLPEGVALDSSGNVYIADTSANAVKEYVAATQTLITLVSTGLLDPTGVAVDNSGNVYIIDSHNGAVKEYVVATGTVTTLVSTGLNFPNGVAVDGSGNVYFADQDNNAVKEYVASTQTVTTLVSTGLNSPYDVAVDSAGNVYIADGHHNAVKELVRAFVPTSRVTLSNAAGSSQLAVVLPSTQSLSAPFAPTSDQSWLTIIGTSNGIVSYSYTANTGTTSRTAHITLLGQTIAITQAPPETVVSGVVFLDYNDNGVLDSGDTGLAGQTVFVDINGTGILAANDPSTVTDANGAYTLDLLGAPAGSYTVEVQLTALEQATGSPQTVTTPGYPQAIVNLGVRPTSTVQPINASPDLFQTPAPANSSAAYLQSLYQAVLGRDPGSGELESNPLANSPSTSTVADRVAIASGFFQSTEYLKSEVDSFYQTYLGRQADSGGEAIYISLLRQGMDSRQVVIMFVTSVEYTSEHTDATDFVQSLFQKVLGRTASNGEISSYVQLLANGTSRATVARGILYSAEAAEVTVNAFYSQFLQRSADPMGLALYESRLESGVDPSMVAAEILASTEFFAKVT